MNGPIVLISGWAMPGEAMATLAEALQAHQHQVLLLQLPGLRPASDPLIQDWDELTVWLDHQLPTEPVVLIGWSLGGMLGTYYASRYPDKVTAVVNLAANACFLASEHWPTGIDPAVLERFSRGLLPAPAKTLQQFALLCSAGSPAPRVQARHLQTLLAGCDIDNPDMLHSLLTILGQSDLRQVLGAIHCPISHLFARDDALVPVTAADAFRQQFPDHRVQIVAGGHGFFMDDPETVIHALEQLSVARGPA